MKYSEFKDSIMVGVKARLGEQYKVSIANIEKNNGVAFLAITISNEKSNVTPCIYLDTYYDAYKTENKTIDEIVEEIISIYKFHPEDFQVDVQFLHNFEEVKDKLRGRFINTKKNKKLLKEVPHREFLDLSLIYSIDYLLESKTMGSIRVKNEMLSIWNVTEEELYQNVIKNMEREDEGIFMSISDMLRELSGEEDFVKEGIEEIPMIYVVSNKRKINGAVQILNKKIRKKAMDLFEKDFMIIPSSVHELLLVSALEEPQDIEQLVNMIRDVNNTQLVQEEILSYHVYRYNRQIGTISIVA